MKPLNIFTQYIWMDFSENFPLYGSINTSIAFDITKLCMPELTNDRYIVHAYTYTCTYTIYSGMYMYIFLLHTSGIIQPSPCSINENIRLSRFWKDRCIRKCTYTVIMHSWLICTIYGFSCHSKSTFYKNTACILWYRKSYMYTYVHIY